MANLDINDPRMIMLIPITCHSVINIYHKYYSKVGATEDMVKFCSSLKTFLYQYGNKVNPINRSIVHTNILWLSKSIDQEYCSFVSKDLSLILNEAQADKLTFPFSTLQHMSKDLITADLRQAIVDQSDKVKGLLKSITHTNTYVNRHYASIVNYMRVSSMISNDDGMVDSVGGDLSVLIQHMRKRTSQHQTVSNLCMTLASMRAIKSKYVFITLDCILKTSL